MTAAAKSPDIHQLAAWHRDGRLDEAEAGYRAILQDNPEDANALQLLGLVLHARGDNDEAAALIRKAVDIVPNNPTFLSNLGSVLLAAGRPEEAREPLETAHREAPADAEIRYNLATALHELVELGAAADQYRAVLETAPGHAGARINLGTILQDRDDFAGAEALFDSVLRDEPDNPLALKNLARLRRHQGEIDAARALFRRAASAAPGDPDIPFGLSMAELLAGNYDDGWRLYEARYAIDANRKRFAEIPEWHPGMVPGRKILVHTEQGFGDVIQFARFVPAVAAMGHEIILYPQPPLARLFERLDGAARVVPWGDPLPDVHCQAPLLSLPRILGVTLDDLPNAPYLGPAAPGKDGGFGVVLGTNSKTPGAPQKSLSPAAAERLLAALPCPVVNLQKDATDEQRHRILEAGGTDPTSDFADFADTADAIGALGLIVSVDTAVAHLAGAMGKPVLLMLPFAKDWRWLLDRDDSPWYPSMRLFRQPAPGDWDSVVDSLIAELEKTRALAKD